MTKPSPFDLTGQVAVITGSSRGIGRSIAENMAAMGAKVVVSSRKAEACEEVAEGIRKAGGEATVIAANISRKDEVEALVAKTIEKYGRLDCMVPNAAVSPYFGPITGLEDEAFDKLMNNNVRSNLWLAKLARPHMVKQGGGTIIIISSIGGLKAGGNLGGYGISKAADFGLGTGAGVGMGRRQHPHQLHCAGTRSRPTSPRRCGRTTQRRKPHREATTPLRRLGEPEDIGGVAAFLASKAAAFITGQIIVADGGVTIA